MSPSSSPRPSAPSPSAQSASSSSPLGVTDMVARITGLGLGMTGLALRAGVEAVARFVPAEQASPDTETNGAAVELIGTVPGAVLGVGYVLRAGALVASSTIERRTVAVLNTLSRPRFVAAPVSSMRTLLAGIQEVGAYEQHHNEVVALRFAQQATPAFTEVVATRLDVVDVVQRMPVQPMLAAIDFNAIAATLDFNALIAHIDVNAIVQRVDLDAVVANVDVAPIAQRVLDEIDLGAIVRDSTRTLSTDAVEAMRVLAMRADNAIPQRAARPALATAQRQPAGIVSRSTAAIIDLVLIAVLKFGLDAGVGLTKYFFANEPFTLPRLAASVSIAGLSVVSLVYLTLSVAANGRTPGMAIMGLRVVTTRQQPVGVLRAFARAVLVLAVGVVASVWILFSRRRASLVDVVVGTSVLYDWSHDRYVEPAIASQ